MACILLWSSAVRVHVSQAYMKMDVTRERVSRILELRGILLSIQTGFSLVNVVIAITYFAGLPVCFHAEFRNVWKPVCFHAEFRNVW